MHPHHHLHGGPPGDAQCLSAEPLIGPDAPSDVRVFHALRRTMQANKHLLLHRIAETGAHPGQAFLLWALATNEGVSQTELADRMSVSRPTITVMVQKMEGAGLIERRPDERDNRIVRLHLTEKGRELQARLGEMHDDLVRDTVTPLSEEDRLELERLLGLVMSNIEAAKPAGHPARQEGDR